MRTPTDLVRKIRHFSRFGYSDSELSEAFDLSRSAVYRIKTRRAYAHVVDDDTAPYLFTDLPKRSLLNRNRARESSRSRSPERELTGKYAALAEKLGSNEGAR